jgi:hypothetical protein
VEVFAEKYADLIVRICVAFQGRRQLPALTPVMGDSP